MVNLKTPIFYVLGAIVIFVVGVALGGMYVKIQYLEGKVSGVQTTPTTNLQPTAPTGPTVPTKVDVKVNTDDPMLGDPKAKLTIVEFADFQCPYCGRFFKDVLPQIKKDYIDTNKAKLIFKHYPLPGHEGAVPAANASLCAKEQNKFWQYHDSLFEEQTSGKADFLSMENLKKYALELGLNATQFDSCLDAQKYNSQVQADIVEANKNGFNGTPSVAVGSTPIIGAQPYAQFKAAIDAELAKTK